MGIGAHQRNFSSGPRSLFSNPEVAARVQSRRDAWLLEWPQMTEPNWARVEFELNFAPPHAKLIECYIEVRGSPLKQIGAIFLICRDSSTNREIPFELGSRIPCTGDFDRFRFFVSIDSLPETEEGRWFIGIQAFGELSLEIINIDVKFHLDDDALDYRPPSALKHQILTSAAKNRRNSVVLCVHNAPEVSLRCVESVLRSLKEEDELILINDGSTSEVASELLTLVSQRPNVIYVEDHVGSGYTKAANRGLSYASGDNLVFLNSDTIVPQGWLQRLLSPFQAGSDVAIVGPMSNRATIQSLPAIEWQGAWADNTIIRPSNFDLFDEILKQASDRLGLVPLKVELVNGFCMGVKREVFAECGIFDERVFATGYGEETDFQVRAANKGLGLAVVPNVLVYHEGSSSYERYDIASYQEIAYKQVCLKHGDRVIKRAYEQSRDILEHFSGRDEIVALFESYKLFEAKLTRQEFSQPGLPKSLDDAALRRKVVVTQLVDFVLSEASLPAKKSKEPTGAHSRSERQNSPRVRS